MTKAAAVDKPILEVPDLSKLSFSGAIANLGMRLPDLEISESEFPKLWERAYKRETLEKLQAQFAEALGADPIPFSNDLGKAYEYETFLRLSSSAMSIKLDPQGQPTPIRITPVVINDYGNELRPAKTSGYWLEIAIAAAGDLEAIADKLISAEMLKTFYASALKIKDASLQLVADFYQKLTGKTATEHRADPKDAASVLFAGARGKYNLSAVTRDIDDDIRGVWNELNDHEFVKRPRLTEKIKALVPTISGLSPISLAEPLHGLSSLFGGWIRGISIHAAAKSDQSDVTVGLGQVGKDQISPDDEMRWESFGFAQESMKTLFEPGKKNL